MLEYDLEYAKTKNLLSFWYSKRKKKNVAFIFSSFVIVSVREPTEKYNDLLESFSLSLMYYFCPERW